MAGYEIFIDSSITILPEDIDKVTVIPMPVIVEGETLTYMGYEDDDFHNAFYRDVKKGGLPSTSMIPMAVFAEYFERALKEDREIIYTGLSSQLSGNYAQALLATKEMKVKYPDLRITCIDSYGAAQGLTLFLHDLLEKKEAGLSYEEAVAYIEDERKHTLFYGFMNDLDHLKRGGRISQTEAIVGNLLNVKPYTTPDPKGAIKIFKKSRGMKNAVKDFIQILEENRDPDERRLILADADNREQILKVKEQIEEKGWFDEIYIHPFNLIIGVHLGPGAITGATRGKNLINLENIEKESTEN